VSGGASPAPVTGGGASPSAGTSLVGKWSGPVQNNGCSQGGGTLTFTIASDNPINGTWEETLPCGSDSGTLTGTASGSALTFTLKAADLGSCTSYIATTTLSGNTMTNGSDKGDPAGCSPQTETFPLLTKQ
jgi:hypothetical protein